MTSRIFSAYNLQPSPPPSQAVTSFMDDPLGYEDFQFSILSIFFIPAMNLYILPFDLSAPTQILDGLHVFFIATKPVLNVRRLHCAFNSLYVLWN
jgi:hypothetical protein